MVTPTLWPLSSVGYFLIVYKEHGAVNSKVDVSNTSEADILFLKILIFLNKDLNLTYSTK